MVRPATKLPSKPPASWFFSPYTEARVLGVMLCESDERTWFDSVESTDFGHFPFRAAFDASRNLEAHGKRFDFAGVVDWLLAERPTAASQFIERADLIIGAPAYRHWPLAQHDVRWLRRLARRREVA